MATLITLERRVLQSQVVPALSRETGILGRAGTLSFPLSINVGGKKALRKKRVKKERKRGDRKGANGICHFASHSFPGVFKQIL